MGAGLVVALLADVSVIAESARLTDVVYESYREPASRAEALALRDAVGDERYEGLLHQRFKAAHVFLQGVNAIAEGLDRLNRARNY